MKRKNLHTEDLVSKGVELACFNEYSNATAFMKFNGVPNHLIVRVLYRQGKVRKKDYLTFRQRDLVLCNET